MRKMLSESSSVNVVEHITLKNMWEYYVLDDPDGLNPDGIETALVVGSDTEIGSVYMPEIEPHIVSRTSNLNELMPPPGWEWVTNEEAAAFLSSESQHEN